MGITYEHLVKEKPWRDLIIRIRVLELSGRQYAAVTHFLAKKKYNYWHVLEILLLKNPLGSKGREGGFEATWKAILLSMLPFLLLSELME